MSNPFRRSRIPDSAAHPTPAYGPVDASNGAPATPPTRKTKKKVKIQTPPPLSPELTHSPDYGRRLSASDAALRAESPPPPPQTEPPHDDQSDSSATADSELEEALRNTRRNSGSLPHPDAAPTSGMKAPYNPFARTLANAPGLGADDGGQKQKSSDGRPALDVDAFTNILMTGSAVPFAPSGRTNMTDSSPRQHDSSSSNINTSSLFDTTYSLHPESPRTSFDDHDDASENEDYEDENATLRALGSARMDDMAPPAPPKTARSKGPQTVSFAEFNQSIPPEFQSVGPPPPPLNPQITSILRPSLSRSHSDLNKPLPPPPKSPAEPPPPVVPEKDIQTLQQTVSIVDEAKKAPPPPPARRKAAEVARPRSSSNQSNDTTDSAAAGTGQMQEHDSVDETANNKVAPPPPPPARKTHSAQPSIAGSSDSSPSHSTNTIPKLVPPPPPRRTPSKLGRNENQSSANAQKPGDAFLSSLIPPQKNPPAPPPRRAGGSKRSSLDGADSLHRRTSGNSFDSERSTSISGLQKVAEPGKIPEEAVASPPASQRDILADMSAFQAEIDALRARSERTR